MSDDQNGTKAIVPQNGRTVCEWEFDVPGSWTFFFLHFFCH